MTTEKKWWQKEYDPIGSLISKARGKGKGEVTHPPAPPAPPKEGGLSGLKDLKEKGMMGAFFRRWKDPAFAKQLQALAARMKTDGVNIKDQKAVKAWVEEHKKEIESGEINKPSGPPVQTFKKTTPDVGRNAPCPCGSKKKYKKCCGA